MERVRRNFREGRAARRANTADSTPSTTTTPTTSSFSVLSNPNLPYSQSPPPLSPPHQSPMTSPTTRFYGTTPSSSTIVTSPTTSSSPVAIPSPSATSSTPPVPFSLPFAHAIAAKSASASEPIVHANASRDSNSSISTSAVPVPPRPGFFGDGDGFLVGSPQSLDSPTLTGASQFPSSPPQQQTPTSLNQNNALGMTGMASVASSSVPSSLSGSRAGTPPPSKGALATSIGLGMLMENELDRPDSPTLPLPPPPVASTMASIPTTKGTGSGTTFAARFRGATSTTSRSASQSDWDPAPDASTRHQFPYPSHSHTITSTASSSTSHVHTPSQAILVSAPAGGQKWDKVRMNFKPKNIIMNKGSSTTSLRDEFMASGGSSSSSAAGPIGAALAASQTGRSSPKPWNHERLDRHHHHPPIPERSGSTDTFSGPSGFQKLVDAVSGKKTTAMGMDGMRLNNIPEYSSPLGTRGSGINNNGLGGAGMSSEEISMRRGMLDQVGRIREVGRRARSAGDPMDWQPTTGGDGGVNGGRRENTSGGEGGSMPGSSMNLPMSASDSTAALVNNTNNGVNEMGSGRPRAGTAPGGRLKRRQRVSGGSRAGSVSFQDSSLSFPAPLTTNELSASTMNNSSSSSSSSRAQARAVRLRAQLEPLLQISTLFSSSLARYFSVQVNDLGLPLHSFFISELSRPFLATPPAEPEACKVAFELFSKMCKDWRSVGEDEELERWLWVLEALGNCLVGNGLGRIRVGLMQQFMEMVMDDSSSNGPFSNSNGIDDVPELDYYLGEEGSTRPSTPQALQSLVAGVVKTLYSFHWASSSNPSSPSHSPPVFNGFNNGQHHQSEDPELVANRNLLFSILNRISGGQIVRLNVESLWVTEWSNHVGLANGLGLEAKGWTGEQVSRMVFMEGLLRCFEGGNKAIAEFVLTTLLERYWLMPTQCPMEVYRHLLNLLCQGAYSLFSSLRPPTPPPSQTSSDINPFEPLSEPTLSLPFKASLINLIRTHFPPPVIKGLDPSLQEIIFRILMSVFVGLSESAYQEKPTAAFNNNGPTHTLLSNEVLETKALIEECWTEEAEMRVSIKEAIKQLLKMKRDLDEIAPVIGVMSLGLSDKVTAQTAAAAITALFNRIMNERLEAIPPALVALLNLLPARHPRPFYRPVFHCAASDKEDVVRNAMKTLSTLATLMGDRTVFLTDAEMMTIALMSDAAASSKDSVAGDEKINANGIWSKARLGQMALLVKLTMTVKNTRLSDDLTPAEVARIAKFADEFESRFAVFLQAREDSAPMPFSQRILIASLLFEIRLLTKSPRRPLWVSRLVNWTACSFSGTHATPEPKENANPFVSTPAYSAQVSAQTFKEARDSFHWLELVFKKITRDADTRSKIQSVGAPKDLDGKTEQTLMKRKLSEDARACFDTVAALPTTPTPPCLRLLASVYHFLTDLHFNLLCPIVWSRCLHESEPDVYPSATFLLMQCGEKVPATFEDTVMADMKSSSAVSRQATVARLVALWGSRFSLLTHPLADRSRRRPFKVGRQQISFVPVEVGSQQYIPPEDPEEVRLQLGGSLPADTRKALAALGWDKDSLTKESKSQRQRLPVSLLHLSQLDQPAETLEAPSSNKSNVSTPGLLRRRSSGGQHTNVVTRHRPIVVPVVAIVLSKLVSLILDPDQSVASCARDAIVMFLRDDPVVFLRPVFEDLSTTDPERQQAVLSQVRRVLAVQSSLPPAFAWQLFNHLAGLLKTLSREATGPNALKIMSFTLPVAAALVSDVSEFSFNSLRKNKIEHLFLPSGAFWFSDPAPDTQMFPRSMPLDARPYHQLAVPVPTLMVAMARTAQNLVIARYLAKAPSDAPTVRKLLGQLELPPSFLLTSNITHKNSVAEFSLADLGKKVSRVNREAQDLRGVSLTVARSWLLALHTIVCGLTRTFNSRQDMETLFDGINRILLVHGDDTSVVALALRICMAASTRFRRMFSSGNGFGLFMPALFKVYCQARNNSAIREAIEYTFRRFYHAHEESFVFQAFGALTPIFGQSSLTDASRKAMAKDLFLLLVTLAKAKSENVSDIAGIRGSNSQEEREAALVMINDKPEVFLGPLTRNRETNDGASAIQGLVSEKDFPLENSIKLFYTVVAFDPSSPRAGQFLRLFRLLLPSFYGASPEARQLLREGIEALASVFSKSPGNRNAAAGGGLAGLGTDDIPNDRSDIWMVMRRLFLLVVGQYFECGGLLSGGSMKKILDFVRNVLKDSSESVRAAAGSFIRGYTASVIGTGSSANQKQVVMFLKDVAPLFAMHVNRVDFSPLLNALISLPNDIRFDGDFGVAELVVDLFISPAVEAVAVFANEGGGLAPSMQTATVSLFVSAAQSYDLDVVGELDRQPASPGFLAQFLLPIILELPSVPSPFAKDISIASGRLRRTWVRVASYVLKAWKVLSMDSVQRTSSASALLSNQLLKLVLVRGERFLSDTPGAWQSISTFLWEILGVTGSFALRDILRPRSSSDAAEDDTITSSSHQSGREKQVGSVQALDYAFWSLAEFLSLRRSPIMLLLRPLIREKLLDCRKLQTMMLVRSFSTPNNNKHLSVFGKQEDSRRHSTFAKPLLSRSPSARLARRPSRSRKGSVEPPSSLSNKRARSRDRSRDRSRSRSPSPSPARSHLASRQHGRRPSALESEFQAQQDQRHPSFEVLNQSSVNLEPFRPVTPPIGGVSSIALAGGAFAHIRHLGPVSKVVDKGRKGSSSSKGGASAEAEKTGSLSRRGTGGGKGASLRSKELAFDTLKRIQKVQMVFAEDPIDLSSFSSSSSSSVGAANSTTTIEQHQVPPPPSVNNRASIDSQVDSLFRRDSKKSTEEDRENDWTIQSWTVSETIGFTVQETRLLLKEFNDVMAVMIPQPQPLSRQNSERGNDESSGFSLNNEKNF